MPLTWYQHKNPRSGRSKQKSVWGNDEILTVKAVRGEAWTSYPSHYKTKRKTTPTHPNFMKWFNSQLRSMASQLQRFLLTSSTSSSASGCPTTTPKLPTTIYRLKTKRSSPCCSAMAMSSSAGIRWGSVKFQGRREEMEDDVIVRSDGLNGFSFAAVFDGHAGFSSVKFLRFVL